MGTELDGDIYDMIASPYPVWATMNYECHEVNEKFLLIEKHGKGYTYHGTFENQSELIEKFASLILGDLR